MKEELRNRLRAARKAAGPEGGAAAARQLRVLRLMEGEAGVACYAALPHEPATDLLLSAWEAQGRLVLLPKLGREPDWAVAGPESELVPGPLGIRQPAQAGMGGAALALARWIVVPGLAGTMAGDRLGTGGGWYDRALAARHRDSQTVLLLRDCEVLDALPVDPWDVRVDWIATETRLIRCGMTPEVFHSPA
ncbi:MAG: 5-formyltetrahydrofolate cyclo-ligase [Propionibacteriaceae bacterium]|nr:5-formyltetrahydrofolate cyclo-ligase [Propionibacteriaceae bacterium]